jgi:hypothetical protein
MPELTQRVLQLARQSLSKGAALLLCGGIVGLVCKLFARQLADPEHHWIAVPANLVLLVLVLAGVSLIVQSRILFHAASTGLTGATFQRVMSRAPGATRATRKAWWLAASRLSGEMLVGAGAAWGLFSLAIAGPRLPPGPSRMVVEVVLGLALLMAALGICLGLWMAYIAVTTAPPMERPDGR